MILSSKQLEELEHLHDSVNEFDDEANVSADNEEFDEASEGALAWRRGMIERAAATVKRFDRKALSSKEDYAVGTLVYDTVNNRFARVKTSTKARVVLTYVSGGEAVLKGSAVQITTPIQFTPAPVKKASKTQEATQKKTKKKSATPDTQEAGTSTKKPRSLKAISSKVINKNTSNDNNKKEPVEPKKTSKKKMVNKSVKKVAEKKPTSKKKTPPVAPKATKKKPTTQKGIVKKTKALTKKTSKANVKKNTTKKKNIKKVAAKPKKKTANLKSTQKPSNPNAFIKKNFKKLSNKEIAAVTGLSEHTIRRKLGEWGLKRPGK